MYLHALTPPLMRPEPTLAIFSTSVLKLSMGIQSSTCVTLTGNKPQHSLGNHPCSTNAKLTSCSFPLPFIDHFKSSCGCKSRTHSLYAHIVQLYKIVVNLSQDSCQEHIVHRSNSTKWERNGLLGWKRGPGDDGIQFLSSTARWGEAWNWQKKCGLLTDTVTHCNCGDLYGRNAWFPFQRKPKCSTQQPQGITLLQMQHTQWMFCSETGHNLPKISSRSQNVFCGPHSGSLYSYS